ncbi:MAG: c-type cytochrome [Anaerolineae bacterium]
MKILKPSILLTLILILVTACTDLAGQPDIVTTLVPPPTTQPLTVSENQNLGAEIFQARCASCHGINGEGDGTVALEADFPVPDFTDPTSANNQTLEAWTDTIRYGRLENMMPPWENSLSSAEIEAVASYTYTMWENDTSASQTQAETDTSAPETAIEERNVSITGTITQGTSDASLPDMLFLGLHVLDDADTQIDFRTLEVENSANYSFDDVTLRADYRYLVTVIHDDVVFSSPTLSGTDLEASQEISLTIYEVTDDPSVIEIDLWTMVLFEENGRLVSQNFLSFANTSDRVFRSNNQVDELTYETVRIPVPADAILLNSQALFPRFELQQDEQPTLVDTRPIIPGEENMIELVFGLPFERRVQLDLPLVYPLTAEPDILLPYEEFEFSARNIEFYDVQMFDFGSFDRYRGTPLNAGDTLSLTVRRPSEGLPVDLIVSGIVLIAGLLFIGVGVYSLYRQRDTDHDTPLNKAELLHELETLEDLYENGKIDEATYQQKRADFKAKLANLMNANEG